MLDMCGKQSGYVFQKSFTKDEQNVSNDFDRFLNSVGKSTTEKNSAQENSTWCPTEDPVISRKYPITGSSFSAQWNIFSSKIMLIQYLTTKLQELTKYTTSHTN